MNVVSIETKRPVEGLSPHLYPAELVERPCHLVCGACGFNGTVAFYVASDGCDPFEPVCNCPLPGVLRA